jgi:hypothetical protein
MLPVYFFLGFLAEYGASPFFIWPKTAYELYVRYLETILDFLNASIKC